MPRHRPSTPSDATTWRTTATGPPRAPSFDWSRTCSPPGEAPCQALSDLCCAHSSATRVISPYFLESAASGNRPEPSYSRWAGQQDPPPVPCRRLPTVVPGRPDREGRSSRALTSSVGLQMMAARPPLALPAARLPTKLGRSSAPSSRLMGVYSPSRAPVPVLQGWHD